MTDTTIAAAARSLVLDARWLTLATVGADGEPSTSYVPFALVEGGFGIVVSALAAHTGHLRSHPRVAALVVAETVPGDDPFARPRLSIDARAHEVSDPADAAAIWDALARRNGETATLLRTLPDFRPFVLAPIAVRAILGFGQAGDVEPAPLIRR